MSNVYLDLETTGLDPKIHCIWEVGLITDNGEYQWTLELYDKELGAATPMALAVGHYYERAPQAAEFAREEQRDNKGIAELRFIPINWRGYLANFLVREIATAHIVGAVPSFDARFLTDFLMTYDLPPAWHYHLVDVEALAAGRLCQQPPWNSKDLYELLGIIPTAFEEHTALGDARMAKAVYEKVFDLTPSYPQAMIKR